jgi:hypothetical protein
VRKQPARPAAQRGSPGPFGCVQFEFGFLLGPPDGRYLVRPGPDEAIEAVLVLGTLGAPERRRLKRPQPVDEVAPEPVPTSRATVVRPEPFGSAEEAAAWLVSMRGDLEARDREVEAALRLLNRALRAHRAAAADPYAADVSAERALVVRLGHGRGDSVADGRFGEALELPRAGGRRVRRSMEAPEELFAAILGGRATMLAAEELVLRARGDLEAGRGREAALEARIALEALLAELGPEAGGGSLGDHRRAVGAAANAALHDSLDHAALATVQAAVTAMEAALRRRRLSS